MPFSLWRMRRTVFSIAAATVALLLGACASYDAHWQAARASRDPYAGAYDGRWQSGRAATGGRLRCVLTQQDAAHYQAWFHATWHGVFQSTHRVVLATRPAGKGLAFAGTATLQTVIGAGSYRCSGQLTPETLNAQYDAQYDTGTFTLTRVKSP